LRISASSWSEQLLPVAQLTHVALPQVVYKADARDNVGTALAPLAEGVEYPVYEEGRGIVGSVRPIVPIPQWHKVALEKLEEGSEVRKFGHVIGICACNIDVGFVVHVTNVLLDPAFDLPKALRGGFVLGTATSRLERGDFVRVGVNFRPTHPLFRQLPPRTKVGVAVAPVREGGTLRLGNIVEPPPGVRLNERYVRLVKDFYRFLRSSFIEFARVQV